MSCPAITSTQFESLIDDNELVFVDFWAAWCAPCKQFSQVYEQVSEQFPSIVFAKVNIEEQLDLAEIFEVRSIPHLMIFKKGIVIYSDAGSMSATRLKELAQQAIDVDVGKIREQLDQDGKG